MMIHVMVSLEAGLWVNILNRHHEGFLNNDHTTSDTLGDSILNALMFLGFFTPTMVIYVMVGLEAGLWVNILNRHCEVFKIMITPPETP